MPLVRSDQPPVTVAVVSWNTRRLLLRCLASLEPEVIAGRARVFVVDNGSGDGSAAAARAAAPWAEMIEPGANIGFGRAVNLVAERSKSDWLAPANADIALTPGALEALLEAGAAPGVGCVAPRLVLEDGSTQHSVYPFPTLSFTVAFNLGLYRFSRRLADRMCLEGRWDPERPRLVPWAVGAFLLLRRVAFEAVGGFSAEQWMYAEDLDLGWRLRDAGWGTLYEPRASVLHAAGAATAIAFGDDRVARQTQATYEVLQRRYGRRRTTATAAINVAGAGVRAAALAPLATISPRRRPAFQTMRMWREAHRQGLRSPAKLRLTR